MSAILIGISFALFAFAWLSVKSGTVRRVIAIAFVAVVFAVLLRKIFQTLLRKDTQ